MQIANPIYDVVFRYLMQDNKVAKLVLSALIGEEILELEFRSTEHSIKYGPLPTVLRMDFAALIKTADGGQKKVLIELQKAKYYLEIMRFRRYLGNQYASEENKIEHSMPNGAIRTEGLRLLPIFILGEKVTKEEIPVLRVGRNYVDVATGEIFDLQHEFIEALTHDGIFVQIPHLPGKRRTELEQLLYVFDQSNTVETQHYFLYIDENDFPQKYRPVIRRLKQAISQKEMVEQMRTEDDIVDMFRHTERELARAQMIADEAKKRADEESQKAAYERQKALEEQQKAEAERQKAEVEKQKAEAERQKAEAEKQKAEAERQKAEAALTVVLNAVHNLRATGMTPSEIAGLLGKTEEEINQLLKV